MRFIRRSIKWRLLFTFAVTFFFVQVFLNIFVSLYLEVYLKDRYVKSVEGFMASVDDGLWEGSFDDIVASINGEIGGVIHLLPIHGPEEEGLRISQTEERNDIDRGHGAIDTGFFDVVGNKEIIESLLASADQVFHEEIDGDIPTIVMAYKVTDKMIIRFDYRFDNLSELRMMMLTVVGSGSILVFILVVVFGSLYINRITKPIRSLKKATEKISALDFGYEIVVNTEDELADLSHSVNAMANTIKSNLDTFVEQTTHEITYEAQQEILFALARAAEADFDETGSHIERVGNMMYKFARMLDYPESEAQMIKIAGTMHDIGKISVPDEILKKPGKLTSEEYQVMKRHALEGQRILGNAQMPIIQLSARIAGFHHERYDGTGYPWGVMGVEIPFEARMMAIVDTFDAMSHNRVYQEACDIEEVLMVIKSGAGTHFDPSLCQFFLDNWQSITE